MLQASNRAYFKCFYSFRLNQDFVFFLPQTVYFHNFEDTKGFIDKPLNLNGQRTFSDHFYGLDHPEGPNEGQNKRNFYILILGEKNR